MLDSRCLFTCVVTGAVANITAWIFYCEPCDCTTFPHCMKQKFSFFHCENEQRDRHRSIRSKHAFIPSLHRIHFPQNSVFPSDWNTFSCPMKNILLLFLFCQYLLSNLHRKVVKNVLITNFGVLSASACFWINFSKKKTFVIKKSWYLLIHIS